MDMEIVSIEKKTFDLMMQQMDELKGHIVNLCGPKDCPENWLDNQDVCIMLDISKRTLQYYRDSGKLPYSAIGYKCYYKRADVEELVNKSYIKPKRNETEN